MKITDSAGYRFRLSVIYLGVILYLSCMSGPENLDKDWFDIYHIDKLAHIIMYGLLAILLSRDQLSVLIIFVICAAYGILMEIIQGEFFEHRHFDILDIIANISGSLIGIGFYQFIKRKVYDK